MPPFPAPPSLVLPHPVNTFPAAFDRSDYQLSSYSPIRAGLSKCSGSCCVGGGAGESGGFLLVGSHRHRPVSEA
eukprot:scaffold46703_cov33-Tisochrysis_lutea.AAC.1